ncbi:MAG: ABC transporter permease protein NatB [Paraeggerthella hongkongensis]|uniref:ABC transporter permease n=1 Tax=Paraeggerthella TaxID=651554 RepID=UPI001C0FCDF0|nr:MULTISPECIES: ABC transporter permease [Paraeggerthella]MBU5406351.1 ABC transporter permease [Paraeggerthella hongkongensis]MCD2433034.1 ABC transporter permease subunit [Paraeggerthella hominis]MDY3980141.1 ABC transporter permease subunit [Paraeggerthella sp.]
MSNGAFTITRKELAKFFSNRVSALVSIVLPGLLIFVVWTVMGDAMGSMFQPDAAKRPVVAVVNEPASLEALADAAGIDVVKEGSLPDADRMREAIEQGDVKAFALFPEGFDESVAAYDPASGTAAPRVELYRNSTDPDSVQAFSALKAALDAYESSLSNRFDVNVGDASYDVAEERDVAGSVVVSIVPMLLLILLFTSCMSVAAESVAGEKERGTMATLLATPVRRRDIALGKVLAVSIIGLLIAASSAIGIFAGLPSIMQGSVSMSVYGVSDYVLLTLVIASTTLVVVVLITMVSALARTTKEASMYLTPLMIVVMLVGALGMFGGATQTEPQFYLIPLYNSVQCMISIFTFDFQPMNVALCVASNLAYTGAGVLVLQRMFDSERLMFAR